MKSEFFYAENIAPIDFRKEVPSTKKSIQTHLTENSCTTDR